jgi:hypothetical protein
VQMFTLSVYFADEEIARYVESVESPRDVLPSIAHLLEAHGQCAHIVVMLGNTKLFAVDCKYHRLPD